LKKKIVILISGRGSNMLRIIDESQRGILSDLCEVALVISNNENAPGIHKASARNITALTVASKKKSQEQFESELWEHVRELKPDYVILAGFMKILSPSFLKKFPQRIINIHPADTRQHQGLNGYKWAFENKLPHTLITVHYVDEKVDGGEIIGQRFVDLRGAITEEEVMRRGLAVEHEFFSEVLKEVFSE